MTPVQYSAAIATAIANYGSDGSVPNLQAAIYEAVSTYDDIGQLITEQRQVIALANTIAAAVQLLAIKGSVAQVSDLPGGASQGDLYIALADGHGYARIGDSWVDLGQVRGPAGDDGREIEVRKSGAYVQWRYVGDASWLNLFPLSDIQGLSAFEVWLAQPGNEDGDEADYLDWLANAQIEVVQPYLTAAQTARDAAIAAATTATGAAGTATTRAGEAAASATAAAGSATAAGTAKTGAEAARDTANDKATIATTKAGEAAASATAAAGSATAAGTAKTGAEAARDTANDKAAIATTKAGEAATSATAAAGSATAAGTAKTGAEAARDTASDKAALATTKAGEAADSATAAAGSATAAGTAKTGAEAARDTASDKAALATTKADEAADSATDAASDRAGAETARAGAETAQAASEAAQAAAEAARDEATAIADGDFQPHDSTLDAVASWAWTAAKQIYALTGLDTFTRLNVGAGSSTDILDRAAGDARYSTPSAVTGAIAAAILALAASDIPNLPASKITSGTFDTARIPALAASAITSGTFDTARIPALAASAIASGVFDVARIPSLPASILTSGTIDPSLLPAIAITDTWEVSSQSAMLALTAQRGDIAIRTDLNKTFVLATESPSTLADWKELRTPTDAVLAVAGLTGTITASALKTALSLAISDVSGLQAALDAKLPYAGGQMTGRLDLKATQDVASAATALVGAATSNFVRVTGTTGVTGFDSQAAGYWVEGYIAGVQTWTHNATSFILPGAANITTAAGDSFRAVSLGSGNWKVTHYQRADGTPLKGGATAWLSKNANYTAVAGDCIEADTSGGAFTVTLPATPAANTEVRIRDVKASFATNPLTLGRNSSTIEGSSADLNLNINRVDVTVKYIGSSWRVVL